MEVSIDEPLNVDWDGNELLLSDILGTDDDVISRKLEDEVEITLLGKAINKLSPREQTIIRLRFGLNNADGKEKTQKEVADLLGISQSYISRLEKKIMKRLKKEMEVGIMKLISEFWKEEDAVGVVEVILILVVLIGLVLIFKKQLVSLVNSLMEKVTNQSNTV